MTVISRWKDDSVPHVLLNELYPNYSRDHHEESSSHFDSYEFWATKCMDIVQINLVNNTVLNTS